MGRIQKLKFDRSILDERCCRKSYGMACMESYNKKKHLGQQTWKDPLDKKLYVPERIDWFVKQVCLNIITHGKGRGSDLE